MLEILGEDRERIEELHREIKRSKSGLQFEFDCNAKSLDDVGRDEFAGDFERSIRKNALFATTTLVNDLKDGFTGGAADAAEAALKSVKKPILLSPIKGGM